MTPVPTSPESSPKNESNMEITSISKNPTEGPRRSSGFKSPLRFEITDDESLGQKRNKRAQKMSDDSVSQGFSEESAEQSTNDEKYCSSTKQRRRTVEYSPIQKVHIDDMNDFATQPGRKSAGKYMLSIQNNANVRLSIDFVNDQTSVISKNKNIIHSTNSSQPKEIKAKEVIESPRASLTEDQRIIGLYQLIIQEKSKTKMNKRLSDNISKDTERSSLSRAIDLHSSLRNKKIGTRITDFDSYSNDKNRNSADSARKLRLSSEFDQKSKLHFKQQPSTERRANIMPTNTIFTKDWATAGLHLTKVNIHAVPDEAKLPTTHPGQVKYSKPEETFVTGSQYEGYWNALGFSGFGTYTFVHGAIYNGSFKNGEFHGFGSITYPSGIKVKGQWKNGKLVSQKIVLDNGLEIAAPWTYCEMPDRRFQLEHNLGCNGADEEYITNKQPAREIPIDCYDATDGYFEPDIQCIFKYAQPTRYSNISDTEFYKPERGEIVRIPLRKEVERILQHHRRAEPMPAVGYRPDLYEEWVTGEQEIIEYADEHESYYSFCSENSSNENVQLEVELLRTK